MSIGGGKKNSQSTDVSEQNAYGYNSSASSDISRTQSESGSMGGSSSTQDIAFGDFFKSLYGGASKAADAAVMQAPQLMQIASQLFTGGGEFLQGMKENSGAQYMQDRLTGDDSVLRSQIGEMQNDLGKFYNEQLNPAITSRAVAGGNLGGGRQGVAQGMAMQGVTEQMRKGSVDLRAKDQAQKDSIAGTIAQNSIEAASTGLGALPSLMDIAGKGANAELGIYSNLASILGGPTTLTTANSYEQASSTSQGASDAASWAFGENKERATRRAQSSSSEFDFNAGLW
jgi:hypothetical protein